MLPVNVYPYTMDRRIFLCENIQIRARALHFLHKRRPVSDTDTSLLPLIKSKVFDAFNAATDSTVKTF